MRGSVSEACENLKILISRVGRAVDARVCKTRLARFDSWTLDRFKVL